MFDRAENWQNHLSQDRKKAQTHGSGKIFLSESTKNTDVQWQMTLNPKVLLFVTLFRLDKSLQ